MWCNWSDIELGPKVLTTPRSTALRSLFGHLEGIEYYSIFVDSILNNFAFKVSNFQLHNVKL